MTMKEVVMFSCDFLSSIHKLSTGYMLSAILKLYMFWYLFLSVVISIVYLHFALRRRRVVSPRDSVCLGNDVFFPSPSASQSTEKESINPQTAPNDGLLMMDVRAMPARIALYYRNSTRQSPNPEAERKGVKCGIACNFLLE